MEGTPQMMPLFAVRIVEQEFTKEIERRIKKFVWADKLFSASGRKFSITFAEGTNLVLKAEIHSTIKLVMFGVNVLPGGQAKLTDIATMQSVISLLQRASKHLQVTDLVPYRTYLFPGKKAVTDYELPEELGAIPKEDAEIISFSYTVRDKVNGNVVEIGGQIQDPPGHALFNGRVRLFEMRREDD